MQIYLRHFNLYFALMAALALLCGCRTDKNAKLQGALRVHIEAAAPTETSQTISILRSSPVLVTILKEPILTEANIVAATVINSTGGFAIQIQFDENGLWILEQYSAANSGKHFAIYGQWNEKLSSGRWLAAPLITRRISEGILTFTPDASREEADQLVLGLNNVVKQALKSTPKTLR